MVDSAQQRVQRFLDERGPTASVASRLLDLVSETGELSKEWLQATDYDQSEFAPTAGWLEELGDVYFCLLSLASLTAVDLEQALDEALAKYRRRLAATGRIDSGR